MPNSRVPVRARKVFAGWQFAVLEREELVTEILDAIREVRRRN